MKLEQFLTHSLQDARLARVLLAALSAVEPGTLVRNYLTTAALPPHRGLAILGLGKASERMVLAAAETLPDFSRALIITKQASAAVPDRVTTIEGGHPVPDARSVMAGRAALDLVSGLSEEDLLLCLISGGGSSLATAPRMGISLRDMQLLTSALLAAGARIDEINTLRRHLDAIKGGGLARATKARVVSLLLSDVIGDRFEAIASGPTAPDPTTGTDALAILNKYEISVHSNIYSQLSAQPVEAAEDFTRVRNVLVGNSELAVQAAKGQAEHEGLRAEILSTGLQGEASLVGQELAARLRAALRSRSRPFCLIAAGETTVTVHGQGKGGRNQELALGAVNGLDGARDALLISLATDGDDGPTDAAGAVVTGETQGRAMAAGMEASEYLSRNDSYRYFEALGDLLKPGYSGTNVNDLILLAAL